MTKSVLITGCSEGSIGNALAIEFAKKAWTVYASARTLSKMSNLREYSNIKLIFLDVTDGKSVHAARDLISKEQGGKLDMLYNNAGVLKKAMAIDYNSDEQEGESYFRADDDWIFQSNVTSVMALTRAFSKLVIAAKGSIVMTGSGVSRVPMPGQSVYNASKAAIEMYSRTLRLELQPFGVQVVYVMTGMIDTPMGRLSMPIPKNSLYAQGGIAQGLIKGWADAGENTKTTPQVYAREVVKQLVKTTPPPMVWSGDEMSTLWLVEKFNLGWILDGMFARRFGLDKTVS